MLFSKMERCLIIVFGTCILSNVVAADDDSQSSPYHWVEMLLSKVIRFEMRFDDLENKLAPHQKVCDDNWTKFQASCYLFGGTDMDFLKAQIFCKELDAHLVSINNESERDFIKDHASGLNALDFWIGLTDIMEEGVWKWTDTSEVAQFVQWHSDQPNGGTNENCVFIRQMHNFRWVDVSCAQSFRPICEK